MRGTLLISHCRIPLRVCTHFTAKDIHMRQSKTVLAKLHALSQHPTGIAVEGIYTYVITPGSVFHSLLEFVILLIRSALPQNRSITYDRYSFNSFSLFVRLVRPAMFIDISCVACLLFVLFFKGSLKLKYTVLTIKYSFISSYCFTEYHCS